MQLTLSCSLFFFLASPLDTSLAPIINVTVYIFPISGICRDANIWGIAEPEKLKIPLANGPGSLSGLGRDCPILSSVSCLWVFSVLRSTLPTWRHERHLFSLFAQPSSPLDYVCGICRQCSSCNSKSLRPSLGAISRWLVAAHVQRSQKFSPATFLAIPEA